MRYVALITSVGSDHLDWHRARLTFIARFLTFVARFTTALLTQTTTNLKRAALTLKASVKPTSNYRRIQLSAHSPIKSPRR
jgi:UDP-N-acetylmuramoylalanine-D-glutamate ligase